MLRLGRSCAQHAPENLRYFGGALPLAFPVRESEDEEAAAAVATPSAGGVPARALLEARVPVAAGGKNSDKQLLRDEPALELLACKVAAGNEQLSEDEEEELEELEESESQGSVSGN
jgi:hypothetical protein